MIRCRRDPMDTCLSCYTRFFASGQPFSWDLVDLGHYHREHNRLAEHWRAMLPIEVFEVDYEQLVADQEQVSRDLIAFCDLTWSDECLAFHETDRPVKTTFEVRRPIYASSVGRWRRFEKHLEPLERALEGKEEPGGGGGA